MSRRPAAVRAYRAVVRLLPGRVRSRDADEMVAAFARLWAEARGMGEATRLLARCFGGLARVAAAEWWDHLNGARRARSGPLGGGAGMGDGVVRSVRLGTRSLVRAPAFTWSTVLLLGLGVGAVTTIFTLADHLFLRPLPYPEADRLIRVQNGAHSHPSLRDFAAMPSVEAWAASAVDEVNLTGSGDPVRIAQARTTEGFFAFFGARPGLGRLLVEDDFAAPDVAVLSHAAWDRLWGRDAGVVGRTIRIDGAPVRVVGVLDGGWSPPEAMLDGVSVDVWRPVDRSHPMIESRGWQSLNVAGRLAPGRTIEEAQRDADVVAERRAREHPDVYARSDGQDAAALPIVSLQDATVGAARQGVGLLLAAVGLLLLVACVNVAHLFMARGIGRARELAVRRALGAGTRALAGQLLTESLLVAAGGALVGVVLASLGLGAFMALSPDAIPRADAVRLDLRVLAFTAGLAAATAIVFGLLPAALRLLGRESDDGLRSGGRGATSRRGVRSLRSVLVAAEVALSLVLVFSAGLLIRSFQRLHDQPLGFRTADVWTLPLGLVGDEDMESWTRRMDGLTEALAAVPGVRSVTFGMSVPLEHTGGNRCCWRSGVVPPGVEVATETTIHPFAGAWFDVFEPALLAGRAWSADDLRAAPPPAVLNESLAVQHFGSAEAAVGRELVVSRRPHRVVGVVADDRHYGIDIVAGPAIYIPMSSVPFVPGDAHVAVRFEGASADEGRRLREAVWSVEPDLPVPLVRSMDEWAELATSRNRFDSVLFAAFGAVALLLAAGGVYGTLLYTVGMERREFGIRLALGAGSRSIEARVLRRGLATAGAGIALGAVGAWAAGRFLESRLFQVEPRDPATFAGTVVILLLSTALACWLPARRAAATDPLETLREE